MLYMLSAPHTRALPFARSLTAERDIYSDLLISRFLCLLPAKGALELPFCGTPLLQDFQRAPWTPRLAQAHQKRAAPTTSQPVLPIRPRATNLGSAALALQGGP